MAGATFLHGVEVIEIDDGPRPIRTVRSSVIHIVGTAPNADPLTFPLNTDVLIAGSRAKAARLDMLGTRSGTLPGALDLILDQIGAVVIVHRVEEGANFEETLANVIGGTQPNGQYFGVHSALGSQMAVGQTPRIMIAPGFTGHRPEDPDTPGAYLENPVVAEMLGIASRIKAHIIADAPNTTDEAALQYAAGWGSRRVYVVDPHVTAQRGTEIVDEPMSAMAAGIIARTDNDRGFHWSPSNQLAYGIIGAARPIDFALGDANSRANLLNEGNVATLIRENGWRLWGNRTCSADPRFAFLNVSRTSDIIADSILRAHLWAVDRNITRTYYDEVAEGVNAFGRDLTAAGIIAGLRCYPDPDLNSASQRMEGKVWFNVDWEPYYPAEHVIFRQQIVNGFLAEAE